MFFTNISIFIEITEPPLMVPAYSSLNWAGGSIGNATARQNVNHRVH
jgi:hypothetical protein